MASLYSWCICSLSSNIIEYCIILLQYHRHQKFLTLTPRHHHPARDIGRRQLLRGGSPTMHRVLRRSLLTTSPILVRLCLCMKLHLLNLCGYICTYIHILIKSGTRRVRPVHTWFLKITSVQMYACVCVSAPKAMNN